MAPSELAGARSFILDPAVLWIDDEIDRSNALVRLLTLQGFAIDCAASAGAGLSLARTRRYHGIILDLRLPDLHGLEVLKLLNDDGIHVPVLVLTGYVGGEESASSAMRAGATDFRRKPIFDDELIAALRRMIEKRGEQPISLEDAGSLQLAAEAERRVLLSLIARLRNVGSETPVGEDRQVALRWLTATLAEPVLAVGSFLAVAEAFRQVVTAPESEKVSTLAPQLQSIIERTLARAAAQQDQRVTKLLVELDSCVRQHTWPYEADIARIFGLSAAHLGRLLNARTGVDFHETRRALAMMHGWRQLTGTDELVSQVAYSVGYQHASQFDRDFRALFGCTPRTLRRLLGSGGR